MVLFGLCAFDSTYVIHLPFECFPQINRSRPPQLICVILDYILQQLVKLIHGDDHAFVTGCIANQRSAATPLHPRSTQLPSETRRNRRDSRSQRQRKIHPPEAGFRCTGTAFRPRFPEWSPHSLAGPEGSRSAHCPRAAGKSPPISFQCVGICFAGSPCSRARSTFCVGRRHCDRYKRVGSSRCLAFSRSVDGQNLRRRKAARDPCSRPGSTADLAATR